MLVGVDFDFQLSAAKLKAEGVDFGIFKVSQGVYFRYPDTGKVNIADFQAKGLIAGAYHFLTLVTKPGSDEPLPANSGSQQCDFFVSQLPQQSPEGVLCAVDVEWNANPAKATIGGTQFQPEHWVKFAQIRSFVARWAALFPRHPLLIYSNERGWPGRKDVRAVFPRARAWHAYWEDQPRGTAAQIKARAEADFQGRSGLGWGGFSKAQLVQYGPLRVAGLDKDPDGDVFFGSTADLRTWTISSDQGEPDRSRGSTGLSGWFRRPDRCRRRQGTRARAGRRSCVPGGRR